MAGCSHTMEGKKLGKDNGEVVERRGEGCTFGLEQSGGEREWTEGEKRGETGPVKLIESVES